jgi:DNA modification methylase
VYHDRSTGNVIRCARQNHHDREHQTQKPVELMRRLVRVVAPLGGTVLDPFAGSGSTGVACIEEGRSFIGIEREAAYVDIARRRIADAQAQTTLGVA